MGTDNYAPYDIALMLKKAGFNWKCTHYYTREDAPDGYVWLTASATESRDYNQARAWNPPAPLCSAPTFDVVGVWLLAKWLEDEDPIITITGATGWDFLKENLAPYTHPREHLNLSQDTANCDKSDINSLTHKT